MHVKQMKKIITPIMTVSVTSISSVAQEEKKFVEQTIIQFVKGTGSHDVYSMNYLLHDDFRAFVASAEEAIVSKSAYMKMLGLKRIGGEELHVEILYLDISSNTASAKVKIIGKREVREAYYQLFMESNGSWQILHVLPINL